MDLDSCSSREKFALQVLDDSMEPEFKKGCIILIQPDAEAEHESYVLAMVENGYIFRQLLIENGQWFLSPLHEDYMHEKRTIEKQAIKGVIVSQAGTRGKRSDMKTYY